MMSKRLGVISHLYAQPLFHKLMHAAENEAPPFTIVNDVTAALAVKLRQKELDGAFLSPIDYAKDYAKYRIVPNVGVVSEGDGGVIQLLFNEHLRDIKTIAVDATSSSEIVLANIVLKEKHNIIPTIIPTPVSPEEALKKADAVLLVGDTALSMKEHSNRIDLVDEWTDITEFPFVHGVWVAREKVLSSSEMQNLIDAAQNGMKDFPFDESNLGYLEEFDYELKEEAVLSLTEFFRMAFYHGILKDIPDVKFHSLEEQNHRPVSLN